MRGIYSKPWYLLAFITLFIFSAWINFNTYIANDLAWHIIMAQNMLNGKILYKDLFEVNTPAIIYFTIIPTYIADKLALDPYTTLNTLNFALICAICLYITQRKYIENQEFLNIGIFFILTISPNMFQFSEFGQKEHLFIALSTPFILSYLFNKPTTKTELILLSVGSLIKPYTLIIAAPILLYTIYQKNSPFIFAVIFAAINATYYAFLYIFHPYYFSEIIPIGGSAYLHFNIYPNDPMTRITYLSTMTFITFPLNLAICSIPALLIGNKSTNIRFLILTFASLVFLLIQSKGFIYHYLPVVCFTYMACLASWHLFQKKLLSNISIVLLLGTWILITSAIISTLNPQFQKYNPKYEEYINLTTSTFEKYNNKSALLIFNNMHWTIQTMTRTKLQYDPKFHSYQILNGIQASKMKGLDTSTYEEYINDYVLKQLQDEPELLVIEQPQIDPTLASSPLSVNFFFNSGSKFEEYFSSQPKLQDLLKRYKVIDEIRTPQVYIKIYALS